MSKYFSTNQLLERYDLTAPKSLYNWRVNKGFPKPKIACNGGKNLYDAQEVQAWEEKQAA